MNEQPKKAEEMVLYAWVGQDDAPPFSGEFGIKGAMVPAGWIPMVACKEEKMRQDYIISQMQALTNATGKPRMLVRFKFDKVLLDVK